MRKDSAEKQFVLAIPDARVDTVKNTIDHSRGKIGVKAAGTVKPGITKNLWSLREDNLLAVQPRQFVVTTDSNHELEVYLNLAYRMKLTGIDQLWVADITYIRLRVEFVYLAVILDGFSRKVVGWELDRTLAARLPLAALEKTIAKRQPRPGLIHHSDRGVQYASGEYVAILNQHQMIPSMSRPANPYDKGYASYCTSWEPCTTFSGKRHRSESLIPWALRGGFGPGSSYSHSFLSHTG